MSTRESMRRELKELAKLAETMRKDAASEAKPNAYSFEAEAVAEAAAHTPDRPLSASSVTVPPVVPPSLYQSIECPLSRLLVARRSPFPQRPRLLPRQTPRPPRSRQPMRRRRPPPRSRRPRPQHPAATRSKT